MISFEGNTEKFQGTSDTPRPRYTGRVVYLYAFDIAYEMNRKPIHELLGYPVAQFSIDASKRSPRQLFFYRPQMIRLIPLERMGPHGPIRVERTVKILPVGAISISISVPFAVDDIGVLVTYHDLEFNNGSLIREVRDWAEEIRLALAPYVIRPVQQLPDEEAYTVFCLNPPVPPDDNERLTAESWLKKNRRAVAALLNQETDAQHLSTQEAEESTNRFLSYYEKDLAVLDWDAALIIEDPANIEETIYVLELANLQLAELEACDRILDEALDRSYRDLTSSSRRSRGNAIRGLREIRIDLARLSDELSNRAMQLTLVPFYGFRISPATLRSASLTGPRSMA